MTSSILLSFDYDIIAIIFSKLIIESFHDFANLFWVWHFNQSISTIRNVLRKLDWDQIYVLLNEPVEGYRDRFEGFLKLCLELDIEQAHFLYSTKMLLRGQCVHHHLHILKKNSTIHFPSYFSYLVFKGMHCPFHWDETVKEMGSLLVNPATKKKVLDLIYLIREINDEDAFPIFPIYKLCPNAKNKQSFLHSDWFPNQSVVWVALCDKVVTQSADEVDVYEQYIRDEHILQTNCSYCSLQCILYRVAHGLFV